MTALFLILPALTSLFLIGLGLNHLVGLKSKGFPQLLLGAFLLIITVLLYLFLTGRIIF